MRSSTIGDLDETEQSGHGNAKRSPTAEIGKAGANKEHQTPGASAFSEMTSSMVSSTTAAKPDVEMTTEATCKESSNTNKDQTRLSSFFTESPEPIAEKGN